MTPAHLRDHAKTAGVIATFGDFYVGRMRRRKPKTRRFVIGNVTGPRRDKIEIDVFIRGAGLKHALYNGAEFADLIESDEGVDFGKRLAKFGRETLRHATAYD